MTEQDAVERTLALARDALSPPASERGRIRSLLGPAPWASPSHGAVLTQGAVPPYAIGTRMAALLASALLAAVGSSFASGFWLGQRRSADPPPKALAASDTRGAEDRETRSVSDLRDTAALQAPALDVGAALEPITEKAAEKPAARKAAKRAAQRAPTAGPSEPPASPVPVDEIALLRRVERALRTGEPALALGLLDELDQRFPNTMLDEERSASSVMAHCQLHDPGAAQRAAHFLGENAASVYAAPVRASCDLPALGSRR